MGCVIARCWLYSMIMNKKLSLTHMLPNMITLLGLCVGLSAIRFSLLGKWEMAVACIIIAALIDGLDGRLARKLGSTSSLGAQLDSFTDFINFGVAPPLMLYVWHTSHFKAIGWGAVLLYVICCALRLARFNAMLADEEDEDPNTLPYFLGVPAPSAGGLMLLPFFAWFLVRAEWPDYLPIFNEIYVDYGLVVYSCIIGFLMVSRIPTPNPKQWHITPKLAPLAMFGLALSLGLLIVEPWATLLCIGVMYLCIVGVYSLTCQR